MSESRVLSLDIVREMVEDRLRLIEESCNSYYTNHMTGVVRGMVWAYTGTDPGGADTLRVAVNLIHQEGIIAHMNQPSIDLNNLFTYHAPKGNQAERYGKIRESAKAFAQTILDCTPIGSDQTAAIRKVREATFTANAAIACGE